MLCIAVIYSLLAGATPQPTKTAEPARAGEDHCSSGTCVAQPIVPTNEQLDALVSGAVSSAGSSVTEVYYKDNGCKFAIVRFLSNILATSNTLLRTVLNHTACADIDLYRGASGVARTCLASTTGMSYTPRCPPASVTSPATDCAVYP